MADNIINQEQLLGAVDRILQKRSIAARVSEYQPMTGPLGIVLGTQRDKTTDKLIVRRKEIQPVMETVKTEFTEEALQDMLSLYGENIYEVLGYYLVDDLMYTIDSKFMSMLKTRAGLFGSMSFNHADYKGSLYAVGQSIGMAVVKGLTDLPISDNRHPEGFAIVSPDVGAVLALSTTLGDPNQTPREDDNSASYMGTLAGVDYYIDYTHAGNATDNVVFGIKGNGISRGTAVFSPYKREWVAAVNPESGEKVFHLFDRTGMTINPIDDIYIDNAESSAFCGKLNVDLGNMAANFGYTGRP
jgi:hypothetical protein